jgi:hypothetical protein
MAYVFDEAKFRKLAHELKPVGSRVTCNPPPMDTDQDWLIHISEFKAFMNVIEEEGWDFDGSDVEDRLNSPEHWQFESYSNGKINLIATTSAEFYRRFLAATSVAKRLNLLDKKDRIALFQAVLYGNEDHPFSDVALPAQSKKAA